MKTKFGGSGQRVVAPMIADMIIWDLEGHVFGPALRLFVCVSSS